MNKNINIKKDNDIKIPPEKANRQKKLKERFFKKNKAFDKKLKLPELKNDAQNNALFEDDLNKNPSFYQTEVIKIFQYLRNKIGEDPKKKITESKKEVYKKWFVIFTIYAAGITIIILIIYFIFCFRKKMIGKKDNTNNPEYKYILALNEKAKKNIHHNTKNFNRVLISGTLGVLFVAYYLYFIIFK